MIPKRTLTATLEISTGSMIITNRPPAFTGEADALTVSVSVLDGGAAYTPVGNVLAKLYLYWPGTINMSEAVDLTITGSTLTGSLPDTLTAVPGCPLMVIQLTDTDSGDLIVAAATPIQITSVLGERVISSRPATPSEIIYIGRSPYIDVATGHWMQWDTASSGYIDTGVSAAGRPATFSATATSPGSQCWNPQRRHRSHRPDRTDGAGCWFRYADGICRRERWHPKRQRFGIRSGHSEGF